MIYLCLYVLITAHDLDAVRVKGYIAASLMDSFEWLEGYTVGFGLHHVDFTNPNRPRTPKYSAHYYYQVMKDNGFPTPDDEKPLYGRFREDFIWSTATASYQVTALNKPVYCIMPGSRNTYFTHFVYVNLSFTFTVSRLKVDGEQMEKVSASGTSLLTLLSECSMMIMGT